MVTVTGYLCSVQWMVSKPDRNWKKVPLKMTAALEAYLSFSVRGDEDRICDVEGSRMMAAETQS